MYRYVPCHVSKKIQSCIVLVECLQDVRVIRSVYIDESGMYICVMEPNLTFSYQKGSQDIST